MPEGVEVKLSAEVIRPLVLGKRIINTFVGENSRYKNDLPDGFGDFISTLSRDVCRVSDVQTKGKFMYWTIGDWYMMCTFGMSGQWSPKRGKHPCLGIYLGENSSVFEEVYFNDPRHFGTIKFTNNKQDLVDKLNELGWDPLGDDGVAYLNTFRKVSSSNKSIGQLLMDQKLFAGVGNYIRAEALYAAEISPWRTGNMIKADQLVRLFDALKVVMQESYQHQGATIRTYKTVFGEDGKYSSCFKVYDQKQDPLGNLIVKEITPEGRTIHWCPSVQK